MLNACHKWQYLQERKVNCVNAATLNLAVGRVVCGAAVEGDPGPRRTQKVRSSMCRAFFLLLISTPFEHKSSSSVRVQCHISGDNWINYTTYQPQTLSDPLMEVNEMLTMHSPQCSKRAEINSILHKSGVLGSTAGLFTLLY